jgi:hypothetical protein
LAFNLDLHNSILGLLTSERNLYTLTTDQFQNIQNKTAAFDNEASNLNLTYLAQTQALKEQTSKYSHLSLIQLFYSGCLKKDIEIKLFTVKQEKLKKSKSALTISQTLSDKTNRSIERLSAEI